jgi:LacI family transcriptional regulator
MRILVVDASDPKDRTMRSRTTMADVAREANVSTQTVSRVLNGKGEIRPETRQMVLDVIERMGYRPNALARSLVTNRTGTIGLIVPDIGNPFFAEVVRGVEDTARIHGFTVLLCNTDQMPERELSAFLAIEDKWVDGIILCASRLPDDQLTTLAKRRQGVVLVSHEPVDGVVGSVRADDECGTIEATRHLLARGRKRITFLAGKPGGPSHRARLRGFQGAVNGADLEPSDPRTKFCISTPAGGYQAAREVLRERPDLEALLCFNDLVAIGALRACIEAGVRVPEDVHVVGFDDNVLASMVQPQLTTVRRPKHEIGSRAMELLIAHLNGVEHPRDVVLPAELVVRASAP